MKKIEKMERGAEGEADFRLKWSLVGAVKSLAAILSLSTLYPVN